MIQEGKMLADFRMPPKLEVQKALLISLFKHKGVIKEFGVGEEIVDEIASYFGLNENQRNAFLETIYKKENRLKKSNLWHRLLFRAADNLAKEGLISRPTKTIKLTNRREWMLTEDGYSEVLKILNIPDTQKEILPIKSYEVQKLIKKLNEQPRPQNYIPFENKKILRVTKDIKLRNRGFRQAIIEAYEYKCAVCGLKINSPDTMQWEVEAAHIVPYRYNGKDDIWNGLALCHLHHWAFDVFWFTLKDNFSIEVSNQIDKLPSELGRIGNYELIRSLKLENIKINLPNRREIFPHENAIKWHREKFYNLLKY